MACKRSPVRSRYSPPNKARCRKHSAACFLFVCKSLLLPPHWARMCRFSPKISEPLPSLPAPLAGRSLCFSSSSAFLPSAWMESKGASWRRCSPFPFPNRPSFPSGSCRSVCLFLLLHKSFPYLSKLSLRSAAFSSAAAPASCGPGGHKNHRACASRLSLFSFHKCPNCTFFPNQQRFLLHLLEHLS